MDGGRPPVWIRWPAASQLTIGTRVNGSDAFGSEGFVSAVLGDLSVVANPSAPDPSFWSNPTTARSPIPQAGSRPRP